MPDELLPTLPKKPPLTLPSPTNGIKGAVILPPHSPIIGPSIRKAVEQALADTPQKTHRAVVAITLQGGINFAYAYRPSKTSPWEVDAYIGKTWAGDLQAGAQIVWSK